MRLQEPSEEAFNINSVPREIKSQHLAEKKAPGKKPTGLGAPPSGPPSTVDSYERLLQSIPEFANFGKLFKVFPLNLLSEFYNCFPSISIAIIYILIIYFLPVLGTCGAY